MSALIGSYKNGNYTVSIFDDGTKIRENDLDNLTPEFAENCDVCITRKCSQGCSYCYEGCSELGKHADLNQPWIDTLHPYTELAINGNDMDHPQLLEFLHKLKDKKVIANITVNQFQFLNNKELLKTLQEEKLIYGIGVSLITPDEDFISEVCKLDNIIIHTILGVTSLDDYNKLADHNLKILVLGYKTLGRGEDYITSNSKEIYHNQADFYKNLFQLQKEFNTISFDNLAIEQLHLTNRLSSDILDRYYMGDDGKYTFYIDMVNKTFSKNSISKERYSILDNINNMFKEIINEAN